MKNQADIAIAASDVKNERFIQILSGVLAIGITVGVVVFRPIFESNPFFGYPSIFIISALGNATVMLPVPSFAVAYAAGDVLNPILVGIAAGVGAAIGEMTGYLAGIAGRGIIQRKYAKWYDRLRTFIKKWGMFGIFLIGLIPNPIVDVAGIIAGATRMAWWRFLSAAAVGKSIRFIILAYIGALTL